ncbi:MAG: hypothetical protein AAB784_01295 [Patescibacteria group bacterium]
MKHDNDEQIDNFIKSRIVQPKIKHYIQPPSDFTIKIMKQIGILERRKRWTGYLVAILLSLAPLGIREAWMLVRGNYFSASSLPMGQLIVGIYHFFLSPAALYILLALGVLAFLLRANKLRRNFNYDYVKMA